MLHRTSHAMLLPVRIIAAFAIGVALVAAQSPGIAQAREERGIYETVIKMLLGGNLPFALVVETPPLALPLLSASDWRMLDPQTGTLQTRIEATRYVLAGPISSESFPPGTQLVPNEQIDELFRTAPRGKSPEDRWLPFRTRFKVSSFQALSLPVITDDGLDALVYYSHSCGSLCGETGYALLHRSSIAEAWVVTRRFRKSIS